MHAWTEINVCTIGEISSEFSTTVGLQQELQQGLILSPIFTFVTDELTRKFQNKIPFS